ncbi:Homeobox protein HD-1 [Castilleja foliolosa]|uniref:Homeobox protein HD-1 n=1 Tax=Castilleja foliolosa TaxID=1961234 RepID=A0ABD3DB89_9LAMI
MKKVVAKRSKVVEKNNTGDFISSLPDHLLHQIMSLLPPRYATATSVLSHRWETIWLSFPIIDLDQSHFSNREKLCSCLESTLNRHSLSNLQTVRLRINLSCSSQINRCVCEFMNTVLPDAKILKELDIRLTNYLLSCQQDICGPEIICIRPKEILSSCTNLIFLRIEGCRFEGSPHVDLPKLKTLHLKNMFIPEEFLVELIHSCPTVDTLSVEYCFGIQNVRICHPTIEKLVLGFRNDLASLELNVPRAKSINFHTLANSVTEVGLVKVLGYQNSKKIQARNLETLYLECLVIEPKVLHNIISIFPKMEKLYMNFCDVLGRAQMHSKTLTSLEMNECMLLDEVDIMAPNLQNFDYVHNPESVQLNYEMLMYIRQLSLDSIELEHETLWINSSNFPAIVSLKLSYCSYMKELRITSKKLESLEVSKCEDLEDCLIIAPQLLSFTYSGKVMDMGHLEASRKLCVRLNLEDAHSGHEHVGFVNKFVGFLQKVGASAACMTIEMDYSCTECLMMIKDIHVPPTTLVQHLKLDTWPDVMCLRDLVSCLLCISIHCNNLSINLGWFSLTLQEIKKKEACVPKSNLARIEDHLVRVEMKHFTGSAEEVDLVEFLVGIARHLQNMTIWMIKGKEDDATQKCLEACHQKLHLFDIVNHEGYVTFSRNAI